MLEELADFIVRKGLELGADEVAASIHRIRGNIVRFSNNKVTVASTQEGLSIEMLVSKDKRIALCSSSDPSKNSMSRIIAELLRKTLSMKAHESYAPLPEGPFRYPVIQGLYDPAIAKLGEKCIEFVEIAIKSACESGAETTSGALAAFETRNVLKTSRNVECSSAKTTIDISVRACASSKEGRVYGFGNSCGTMLKDFNPEKAGKIAGEKAKLSSKIVKTKEGKYDVIFDRPALGTMMGSIASMSSAFSVDSGLSFFVKKIEKKMASEGLTIHDDPLMPGGFGSRPYDYEGLPTRKNTIIEKGMVKTYLHNRLTAKKFKAEATANAGWISPIPWNVRVESGTYSDEEMICEMKDGIFVTNVTYLRFQDSRRGDFSAVIRDGVFRIESGEIVGSVRGLRLSDNMVRILKSVTMVGKESEQTFHWWMEEGVPVTTPLLSVKGAVFTRPIGEVIP